MKKLIIFLLFICTSKISSADYWTQKANFGGGYRYGMSCFSIGNFGYFGAGIVGNYYTDFWEYDAANNIWSQKASFPGAARALATAFAVGNKGYIGCGSNSLITAIYYFDFYEWDQATNTWTQKADFTYSRSAAVGFSIGTQGYMATGYSPGAYTNELWEWNSITDQWLQRTSLPAFVRGTAVNFTIGNEAYVGTGKDVSANYFSDFWKWNQTTNTWSQVANLPTPGRFGAVAFVIDNKGYVATGYTLNESNDFWQFDPLLNSWQPKATFGGAGRHYASGIAIGNKGYVGMGISNNVVLGDLWEYTPDSTTGISDLEFTYYDLQVNPNPAKDFIKVALSSKQQKKSGEKIKIADVAGKIIYTSTITSNETLIDVKKFAKGVYTVKVDGGKQSVVKKFLKD